MASHHMVVQIMKEIKKDQKIIDEYNDKIKKVKRLLVQKKRLLWEICCHKWYIDRDDYSSSSQKKCLYCGLNANPNYI